MNGTNFIIFLGGITVGYIAGWLSLKKHYEQIVQEELESIKSNKFLSGQKENKKEEKPVKKDDLGGTASYKKYSKIVKDGGYKKEKEDEEKLLDKPYVIHPDEFGEEEDYMQINLTYYAGDDVLADDMDNVVEDIENTVGENYEYYMGKYEHDTIHIRNDKRKCYYEITKDLRSYSDVAGE